MTQAVSPRVSREIAVIKYGGSALVRNGGVLDSFARDLVAVTDQGVAVVVVHGAGPQISDIASRLGLEASFVRGLRVTDDAMAEVVQMGLLGVVNPRLVSALLAVGLSAVGLSGLDGAMAPAEVLDADLGRVGTLKGFDARIVLDQVARARVPVIAGAGVDAAGEFLNVNADLFAGAVAVSLGARWLIMMTDVSGLARDLRDPSSLLEEVTVGQVEQLRLEGSIGAGMIPKTEAACHAAKAGVGEVRLVDAALPEVLSRVIIKGEAVGTRVTREGES